MDSVAAYHLWNQIGGDGIGSMMGRAKKIQTGVDWQYDCVSKEGRSWSLFFTDDGQK